MLRLNQNTIELPALIFEKYRGKNLIIKEENNKIVIEEEYDEIKNLKGCLADSELSSELYSNMKFDDKDILSKMW